MFLHDCAHVRRCHTDAYLERSGSPGKLQGGAGRSNIDPPKILGAASMQYGVFWAAGGSRRNPPGVRSAVSIRYADAADWPCRNPLNLRFSLISPPTVRFRNQPKIGKQQEEVYGMLKNIN